jgi:hypothetical protein
MMIKRDVTPKIIAITNFITSKKNVSEQDRANN